MQKNYITLLFALLTTLVFGQKVTLTPTTVNGSNFSGSSVNLASVPVSTISLNVKVEIPANMAAGDNGSLKVYFSKGSALGGNIAIGGDSGLLYFGGTKIATRTLTINLNWTDFLTNGGFIYAEYKSGASYYSSNISVIKNPTMTSGTTLNPPADAPNPSNIVNTLCCDQTIRLGDKPAPITGSQYLNPYKGEPYGINSQWTALNATDFTLDDINKNLDIDYTKELKNITVSRKLGYVHGGNFPNKSNDITITVVPSPIIIANEISTNGSVDSNGFTEIITTNLKTIDGNRLFSRNEVNLNVLENPFYNPQSGNRFASIERIEWEYTKTNLNLGGQKNWNIIQGENNYFLESFLPIDISETEDNYYLIRRIAIYKNIRKVSNVVKLVYRTIRNNNTICCDQILKMPTPNTIEEPSAIIGSEVSANINGYFTYQWQKQNKDASFNPEKLSDWINIDNANAKDYFPPTLDLVPMDNRGQTIWLTPITLNYRRAVVETKSKKTSYSNEINIKSTNYIDLTFGTLIYPNPASSDINIQNTQSNYVLQGESRITIVDAMGQTVDSSNRLFLNPNLININISHLNSGIYFINLERFIGGHRPNTVQFTFIKK